MEMFLAAQGTVERDLEKQKNKTFTYWHKSTFFMLTATGNMITSNLKWIDGR